MHHALSEYAQALSSLTADNLPKLADALADEVEFRDPFNHTYGRDAFIAVLGDMFERLEQVGFEVDAVAAEGSTGMLHWTFSARSDLTGPIRFKGMSRVCFNDNGKVISHYDYWDGAEVMVLVPVIGKLITWLRKKFRH